MRIDLLGWSSKGLRCPDVDIDLRCASGKLPAVSLIQMPNGTGKTTTLELLKAALSGTAQHWDADYIREFRRPGEVHKEGVFRADLLIGGRPASWELTLDFDDGLAKYKTSTPGSGGVVGRYERPAGLQDFLKPDFLNLLIFNGELAEDVLDPEKAAAEKAVDALCQIYLLREAGTFTHHYWEQESKRQTSKTESGRAKWEDLAAKISKRIDLLAKGREEAAARIAAHEKTITRLDKQIAERLAEVETTREAHQLARDALALAETQVRGASTGLMGALRLPHALNAAFGDRLVALRQNLEVLKLPEKASAQFFEELVDADHCVCGREMDDAAVTQIRLRAKDYLDAEENGVINALKRDVDRFVRDDEADSGPAKVTRLVKELTGALREERSADQKVRALYQQLIDEGDEELAAWQKERGESADDLAKCKRIIASIDGSGDWQAEVAEIQSLSALKKKLDDAESRIAEITKTVELREHTTAIQAILTDAENRARNQIKAELTTACNERLEKVLKNDPLRIERIDRSLRLRGQKAGSMGQTLAVGYTFLISALKRGANDFPLVVDSPANSIDLGVRRRTGRVIPELCTQFVAFTINVERPGFVDALESSGAEIGYLTIFRKTPGTEPLMRDLPSAGVVQTDNAVLVWDREYFNAFDVEDEEDEDCVIQAAE